MLRYKLSSTWKTVQYVYAKVSGSWKTVGNVYVKVSGSWKPVWSYSWTTGSWGSCSATCGGGTQTRTVTCDRNDGYTVADSLCTSYVGSKPGTSQSCNTQTCEESYTGGTVGNVASGTGWLATETQNGGTVTQSTYAIYISGTLMASANDTTGTAYNTTTVTAGGYRYTRGEQTDSSINVSEYVSMYQYVYSFTRVAA